MRISLALLITGVTSLSAQQVPPPISPVMHEIVAGVSADRIERDIGMLVSFGTRNTLSDTLSATRGIGAARRWIKAEFDRISARCGGCLEVMFMGEVFDSSDSQRLTTPTNVVNVVAIQRGTTDPNRYVIMSGDIDSRITNPSNPIDSAPGANDNASGMAGTIEAARVLTQYRFNGSIVYLGLSGEEQGLFGGRTVAQRAKAEGWNIVGILNNDMIGNIEGISGTIENQTARVFSQPTPPSEASWNAMRRQGGEVDGPSRQLARYVDKMADLYLPTLDAMMIYRLDRFGRGGHHTPFNNEGFPGVRIMETNENYNRQHQDIRDENGIHYGDVIEGVNFEYAAKLTALNAVSLASLASAPGAPRGVSITGAVSPAAILMWEPPADADNVAGYRVYWRLTDSPTWDFSRGVDKPTEWEGKERQAAQAAAFARRAGREPRPLPTHGYRFDGLVIDNFFFGVAAVAADGSESTVVFPLPRN